MLLNCSRRQCNTQLELCVPFFFLESNNAYISTPVIMLHSAIVSLPLLLLKEDSASEHSVHVDLKT